MRRCSKCGTDKAAEDFARCSRNSSGRQSHCRACKHAHHSANRERAAAIKAVRYREQRAQMLADPIALEAERLRCREAMRRHYARKKDDPEWRSAKRVKDRQFAAGHSVEAVERVRLWRRSNSERNREYVRLRFRKLRADPNFLQKDRVRTKRWRKTDRGKEVKLAIENRRRARLRGAIAIGSAEARRACFERAGQACIYCDRPLPIGIRTLDHFTAIARGGDDAPWNWVPACRQCNSTKRDVPADEWVMDRFGASRLKYVLDFLAVV